jgi:hypothetical protein
MKISQEVRDFAKEQEQKEGMKQKSKEFIENGAEVYLEPENLS